MAMQKVVENVNQEVSDAGLLCPTPLVSVHMLAYNHADYLAEAIEGVVCQVCDFEFELLIGEDASSDKTLDIALAYQRRYPQCIRVIYSAKNVGIRDNSRRLLAASRGEFVAYCEGDDYWCSESKLARQVSLIAKRPSVGMVHGDWIVLRYKDGAWETDRKSMHRHVKPKMLSGDIFPYFFYPKILRTCTLLLRREIALEVETCILRRAEYKFGDTIYSAYISAKWEVEYVPDVVSVYRVSQNSVLRSGKQARIDFLRSALAFDKEAKEYFKSRSDYPRSYRWELCVGLLLWSMSARDAVAVMRAFRTIKDDFTVSEFIKAGWNSLSMRLPAFYPRKR